MTEKFTSIEMVRRENVRTLMQNYKITRMMLSQGTNINYALLGHYIGKNPIKAIGDETANKIEVFFNKPINWLDHEHDVAKKANDSPGFGEETSDNLIKVPIYKTYFCHEEIEEECYFHPQFFKEKGIDPQSFRLIYATDSSMQPYINIKDKVGIAINDNCIKDGSIYAVILNGKHMMFKQVFIEAGNVLRLHSLHSDYPDKLVNVEDTDSLVIVGRLIYRAG